MPAQYLIANGAMPTTSPLVAVTSGISGATKTMLQVQASATNAFKIVAWGISFNGGSANTPLSCELIQTDVAATVTAHTTTGINKYNAEALANGDPVTNLVQVGTTATGYTASAEGSITAVKIFDVQFIAPTSQYLIQFPLGQQPIVEVGKFARIRINNPVGTAVNVYCYMIIEV